MTEEKPAKKRHTLRNVVLIGVLLIVLACVAVYAAGRGGTPSAETGKFLCHTMILLLSAVSRGRTVAVLVLDSLFLMQWPFFDQNILLLQDETASNLLGYRTPQKVAHRTNASFLTHPLSG